jgi:hypothetical protein
MSIERLLREWIFIVTPFEIWKINYLEFMGPTVEIATSENKEEKNR